jgi:DNA polymerase-1
MSKQNVTIIDADSIVWTVAYKFRDKKIKNLLLISVKSFIIDILEKTKANKYIGFLGSKDPNREPNFRFKIDPEYKSNRPEEPSWLVKWRPVIYDELVNSFGFQLIDGMEVDDACSIAANMLRDEYNVTVASPDKDLKQIPDITYYNYQKHESVYIDTVEAARSLGVQTLKGDPTDGIKGLPKIGDKKAEALLKDCQSVTDIKWTVLRMYASYEEELRSKAYRRIIAEKNKNKTSNYDTTVYNSMQIERFIRIEVKEEVDKEIEQLIPGGWKKFLGIQYNLVKLLDSCDGFVMNSLQDYENSTEEDTDLEDSILDGI